MGCVPFATTLDGSRIVPPRWLHFVQRGFRLSMSLDASGPHLIRNGTSGTATLRPHASQYHHTQWGGALSCPNVATGFDDRRAIVG
jgi:hypothetical protein